MHRWIWTLTLCAGCVLDAGAETDAGPAAHVDAVAPSRDQGGAADGPDHPDLPCLPASDQPCEVLREQRLNGQDRSHIVTYCYDDHGRRVSESLEDLLVTHEYDARGDRVRTHQSGKSAQLTAGDPVSYVPWPLRGGSAVHSGPDVFTRMPFTLDLATPGTDAGPEERVYWFEHDDAHRMTAWGFGPSREERVRWWNELVYDAQGRLDHRVEHSDESTVYGQRTYDDGGRLVHSRFADSSYVAFAYDADDRLSAMREFLDGEDTPSWAFEMVYDGAGRLAEERVTGREAPWRTTTRHYDETGRLAVEEIDGSVGQFEAPEVDGLWDVRLSYRYDCLATGG